MLSIKKCVRLSGDLATRLVYIITDTKGARVHLVEVSRLKGDTLSIGYELCVCIVVTGEGETRSWRPVAWSCSPRV